MQNKMVETPINYDPDVTGLQTINQGVFGLVYKKVTPYGVLYVVKKPCNENKEDIAVFLNELNQPQITHPNITAFYTGEYKEHVQDSYLIFEYVNGGDLFDYYAPNPNSRPCHPISTTRISILLGIAEGLNCLHQNNIAHCDIKPENILLHIVGDGRLQPKICDFGFWVAVDPTTKSIQMSYKIGTPRYMAPEILSDSIYSFKSDVFAFGSLCFVSEVGDIYYGGYYDEVASIKIQNGERATIPSYVNNELATLITSSMKQEPEHRPDALKITNFLRHNFLNKKEAAASVPAPMLETQTPPAIGTSVFTLFSKQHNEAIKEPVCDMVDEVERQLSNLAFKKS